MIAILIYGCIALPPNDCFGQEDSEQPQSFQPSQWRNVASRAQNQVFLTSTPIFNGLSPDDRAVPCFSTVSKSQLMDESETQLCNLLSNVINIIELLIHSDRDILILAQSSQAFCYSPTITVIRNIQRFCSVRGDRVFPN